MKKQLIILLAVACLSLSSGLGAAAVDAGSQRTLAEYWAQEQFKLFEFKAHDAAISMIGISEGDSLLVTYGSAVKVWDLKSRKLMHVYKNIKKVAFSEGSKLLALNSGDRFINIWNAATNSFVKKIAESAIADVEIARYGQYLAVGKTDDTITIYDLKTSDKIRKQSVSRLFSSLFLSQDQNLAVFHYGEPGSHRGYCFLWNVKDGSIYDTIAFMTGQAGFFKFYRDGSIIESTYLPGQIINIDAKNRKKISTINIPDKPETWDYSNDGTLIAAGFSDGSVRIWNLQTGQFIRQFTGHKSAISNLKFSDDGVLLVSGTKDGVINVWQAVH